jgi:type I restriction enzyme S subunit
MPTPAHWPLQRLRWSVAEIVSGVWGEEPDGVNDLTCVRVADFDRTRFVVNEEPPTLRAIRPDERVRRVLQRGDLLLEKSGGGDKQPVGCVVEFSRDFPAVCSNFVGRMVLASGMWPRYWAYVHASLYGGRLNVPAINQTTGIQNLDVYHYLNQQVPFPPLAEQRAIASLLDRETARLDALVAAKKRVLALLDEKRSATSAWLVSHGVSSGVPVKATDIQWMPTIPDHWRTIALGRVTISRCDGPFGSGLKSEHYTDSGVRVVRLQNIRRGRFDSSDAMYIDEGYFRSELSGHEVIAGDVLIAGLGDDNNTVGRACVAPPDLGPTMVKADCFRFRLDRSVADPEFVAQQLTAGAASSAGHLAVGSTRSRIPLSLMASRKVALPPLAEQQEIVQAVNASNADIDRLISTTRRTVDLISERRTALISAAVTGDLEIA